MQNDMLALKHSWVDLIPRGNLLAIVKQFLNIESVEEQSTSELQRLAYKLLKEMPELSDILKAEYYPRDITPKHPSQKSIKSETNLRSSWSPSTSSLDSLPD